MMTTDVRPIAAPTKQPRWRTLAMFRAVKWAREARVPYLPYLADKAL